MSHITYCNLLGIEVSTFAACILEFHSFYDSEFCCDRCDEICEFGYGEENMVNGNSYLPYDLIIMHNKSHFEIWSGVGDIESANLVFFGDNKYWKEPLTTVDRFG